MSPLASVFTGTNGERVALCDCAITAAFHDLLGEVTVTQTYRNDENVNIEAVYTFPLPPDAVLLDFSVTIGGRVLKGTVVAKKAAEERYENAIADGNAAVMLEQLESGLYTMNVGNLLPNETAVISFTYAVMYRWTGDNLRILIPTTVAPRYGESAHAPHQTPEHSLLVENQFSIKVEVFGSLRDASFECPSHEMTSTSSSEMTTLALVSPKASMDRDFILNVKAPQSAHSFAICGVDVVDDAGKNSKEGGAVVASFKPMFPGLRQSRPINLAVVVDCSGSMQGDSITQAKQALAGILDLLQPKDRITIVAFGNDTKTLSAELLPCTDANRRLAREFVEALQADMGGTEIGGALKLAYAATSGVESADIFVVTDGEVSDWERVVRDAKKSGRRIFSVGVGHAVSEAFVRGLATGTGGECELVSPREGMSDRVVRHFQRMRAPRAKRVVVRWPDGARNITPVKFGSVFEGDAVFASAQFDRSEVTGHVVLEIETESGHVVRQEVAIGQAPAPKTGSRVSTVARLAASERIKELEGAAATDTAVRYQLASRWTNWLVVAERPEGERDYKIPQLRKVPQTLAAGWGGVGISMPAHSIGTPDMAVFSRSFRFGLSESRQEVREQEALDLEALEREAHEREAREREAAARLAQFQHEVGKLSDEINEMTMAVAQMVSDSHDAVHALHRQIERLLSLIEDVMAQIYGMERRTAGLLVMLDELALWPKSSLPPDEISKAHEHMKKLQERLHYLHEVPGRLALSRNRLRELESVLPRS